MEQDTKDVQMRTQLDDDVMTPEEIAKFLRVSTEAVEKEIGDGTLPALRIGSEWRILRKDFEQFLRIQTTQRKATASSPNRQKMAFVEAKPFDHRWPERKGQSKPLEHFDEAHSARVSTANGSKRILIGFGNSKKPGHRRKATVFVDSRPMVRFRAADDFARSGLMLSVIKTTDRKHLRPEDPTPTEYLGFRIEPYRNHIDEPYTSQNMAVVCTNKDLQTMAEHALIRATQIEDRKH
ncbi:MAG TPA: helix-turn-helix domain-containing protein [Candidatus Angelobacter sp.]